MNPETVVFFVALVIAGWMYLVDERLDKPKIARMVWLCLGIAFGSAVHIVVNHYHWWMR